MAEEKEERVNPMNIYVLQPGNGKPNDPNISAVGQTWGGGQHWTVIHNVVDMIKHIKSQCGDKFYVATLRIGGHGNDDRFRLGDILISVDVLKNENGDIKTSVKVDELQPWIDEIKNYFIKDKSMIVLDTCYVGQNDLMLKKVSAVFGGIPVVAPFDGQVTNEGNGVPPLLEGKARICNDKVCFTMAEREFYL